jgi:hypothetical protein
MSDWWDTVDESNPGGANPDDAYPVEGRASGGDLADAVESYPDLSQAAPGAQPYDAYVGNFIDNLFGTSPEKYETQQNAIANDTAKGGFDMPVNNPTYYTPRGPWDATDAARGALGGYALGTVAPGLGFVNAAVNAVPSMAHFWGANVSDMTPVGFARMDREAAAQRASDQSAGRGDYAPVNDSPELQPTAYPDANAQRLADGLDINAPTGAAGGSFGGGKKWNLTDYTGGYGV